MSKCSYDINSIYSCDITENFGNRLDYATLNNVDTINNDYRNPSRKQSLKTCMDICDFDTNCTSFVTYNNQTDHNAMDCYYKNSINTLKQDTNKTLSTYVKRSLLPNNYAILKNVDNISDNFGPPTLQQSMETCMYTCDKNKDCTSFVTINNQTDPNKMDCYYKNSINRIQKDPNNNYTTHVKRSLLLPNL